MDEDAGVFLLVALIVGAVIAVPVVAGIVLYSRDYRVDATVTDTRCEVGEVQVRTKAFGIDHTAKGVPSAACAQLEEGNFVQYRIRTQRTTVYDTEGGRCLYDSETGANCGAGFAFPVLP